MKTITALCIGLVFAGLACVAQALTPAQRVVLFNGCLPTFVCQQYGPAGQLPDVAVDCPQNLGYVRGSYNGTASGLIGVTNASGGYVDDLANNWALIAPNTLRRSDKWCLFEEARTNSIRNNSMQGAVPGSPGTMPTTGWNSNPVGTTQTIVGTGVINGIEYIDIRYAGVTTGGVLQIANFESSTQIVAAVGQTWTESVFVALVGGSLSNVNSITMNLGEIDSGGVQLATTASSDIKGSLTSSLQRFSFAVTLGNAATAFARPTIRANIGIGNSVDLTIRLGWPQCELGAWASSPIRTTSAAATRSADVAAALTVSPGVAFSMAAEAYPFEPITSAANQAVLNLQGATSINRLTLVRASGTGGAQAFMNSGGVSQYNSGASLGVWASGTRGRVAVAVTAGAQDSAFNGTGGNPGTGALLPVSPTSLSVARILGAAIGNVGVTKVALWPNSYLPLPALKAWTAQ